MSKLTKNQHYVWQHYLRAWATPRKIWCKRMDTPEPFDTIPRNVGAARFFYEFYELEERDRRYIEAVISQSNDKRLQDINRGWLESFQQSFAIRKQLDGFAKNPAHREELETQLREIEKTMGERFHFQIEDRAAPILDALRKRDCSFAANEKSWVDFIYYLCNQYFRTAKLRNSMLAIPNIIDHDASRTWPIEAFIYATNLGASFARQKSKYRIRFLRNKSDISFITSDQPVINLLSSTDAEIDFYYPLKPDLAMIYTANPDRYGGEDAEIGRLGVESYNHKIFANSDNQIYGNDPAYLKSLSQMPKDVLGA